MTDHTGTLLDVREALDYAEFCCAFLHDAGYGGKAQSLSNKSKQALASLDALIAAVPKDLHTKYEGEGGLDYVNRIATAAQMLHESIQEGE